MKNLVKMIRNRFLDECSQKIIQPILDYIEEWEEEPIPMIMFCPKCHTQHIDAPDESRGWTNPPHKSHLCTACSTIWRPCDRTTTGVQHIKTFGANDNYWDKPNE